MSTDPIARAAAAGLFAALIGASPVLAQPAPGNIDDRVRQQVHLPDEAERTAALMTGDTDIILLRHTPLFTAHATLDVTETSNAALSPDSRTADTIAQLNAGIRIGTTIAGKFDVFADLGLVGARYAKRPDLGYNALVGALGVSARLRPVTVSMTYQPSVVFDRNFADRQLTQHRFRLDAATPFSLAGLQIAPAVSLERSIADPSDYSSWAWAAEVRATRAMSRRRPLFVTASAGFERRRYDGYFTDLLGVSRRDDTVRAGIDVVWRPRPWAEVRAGYDYAWSRSTSDVNGYMSHSGSLGLGGAIRF